MTLCYFFSHFLLVCAFFIGGVSCVQNGFVILRYLLGLGQQKAGGTE